jgi:hypothetical protein
MSFICRVIISILQLDDRTNILIIEMIYKKLKIFIVFKIYWYESDFTKQKMYFSLIKMAHFPCMLLLSKYERRALFFDLICMMLKTKFAYPSILLTFIVFLYNAIVIKLVNNKTKIIFTNIFRICWLKWSILYVFPSLGAPYNNAERLANQSNINSCKNLLDFAFCNRFIGDFIMKGG